MPSRGASTALCLALGLVAVGLGAACGGGDIWTGAAPDAGAIPVVDRPPIPTGTPIAVAVGYGQLRAHSFNGLTWELQQVNPNGGDDNDLFRGVSWGNDLFVAVGGSSVGLTATSPDGVTWTPGGSAHSWIGDAAWIGDTLVATGGNGLRVRSFDKGATWIDDAGFQPIHYRANAAGAGMVVTVGHRYDGGGPNGENVGVIATTSDGATWDQVRSSGPVFGTIAFGAGVFVAAGDAGLVSTSTNGRDWRDQTVGSGTGRVIFTGTRFVLNRAEKNFTSPDGRAWTPVDGPAWPVIGFFDGAYLAASWPLMILRSTNLVDWAPVWAPNGPGITEMVTGYVP